MTNSDVCNPKPTCLVVYSTSWCPDCKRSKAFLERHNIAYLDIDIGKDNDAFVFIEKLTRRVRIPTLIFPDGMIMVEPGDDALQHKLEIK
jgi:glutaredoxin